MPIGFKGFQPGRITEGKRPQLMGNSANAIEVRQQEMVRLLLEGHKLQDIADHLGTAYNTILHWIRIPTIHKQIQEMKAELMEQLDEEMMQRIHSKSQVIDEMGWKALERLQGILQDPTAHPSIVMKVAQDILDRDPVVSKTRKVDITERKVILKSEDLLSAVAALKEIEDRQKQLAAADEEETE